MSSLDPLLAKAFIRIAARKTAIADAQGDESSRLGVQMEAPGPLFVGADLDPDHVMYFAHRMTRTCLAALLLDEIDIPSAIEGQWVDGFLTGLELGKLRAEAEVES